MNAVYFGAMLVGIVWLVIWSALPQGMQGRGWWPFDTLDDVQGRGEPGSQEPTSGSGEPPMQPSRWRKRAALALAGDGSQGHR